ncbi:MAG: Ig-like domain-containing protein [Ilumatobacteraceae bacterium]
MPNSFWGSYIVRSWSLQTADGRTVPACLMYGENRIDPGQTFREGTNVYLFPREPLDEGTKYRATIAADPVDDVGHTGTRISLDWSFTAHDWHVAGASGARVLDTRGPSAAGSGGGRFRAGETRRLTVPSGSNARADRTPPWR